jgi:hypothetical protein
MVAQTVVAGGAVGAPTATVAVGAKAAPVSAAIVADRARAGFAAALCRSRRRGGKQYRNDCGNDIPGRPASKTSPLHARAS